MHLCVASVHLCGLNRYLGFTNELGGMDYQVTEALKNGDAPRSKITKHARAEYNI